MAQDANYLAAMNALQIAPEKKGRGQFTFYRSYYEAIRCLPKKERLAAYEAIASYALDGFEPTLQGVAQTAFILIRPTLDTGRKRAQSGSKGGANSKQTASEKEIEKE